MPISPRAADDGALWLEFQRQARLIRIRHARLHLVGEGAVDPGDYLELGW